MTAHQTLYELESRGDFIRRHIGPTEEQVAHMLATLGLDSLEQIIEIFTRLRSRMARR